ncbi:28S ribosomal protein S10, mitochondrial isoform X2 [Pipistrellus kuhlii]|uniref:28S ribosomal protein S10, mitochondrial isoform X2 n=1 Tax=Pipistrellus kuhlii TaxID=59472 RepID=UPI00174ECEB0|nr:28S ribosomal protein S10, mitochondrial isoform X2 [Pipistrellus kuhlii]
MYFCSKLVFMFACKKTGTTQYKKRFVEENIAGPWKLSTNKLQEPHQDRVPGREAYRSPNPALTKHGTLSLWSFRCRNRGYTLSSCGTLWSRTPCDLGSDPGTPTARWRRAQRSGPCAGASGRQGPRDFSVNSSKISTPRNGAFLLSSMKWVQFSNLHVDLPKDVTRPEITISDEPDTLYKRLSVLVKGHDKAVLDSYEYFAVLAAKELGISIEVHEPPRKIERFTLLKSVHIFKKHRVQYEMRTLYRCFELKHLTGSTADVYLEYIQRNLPEGVAMEVAKTKLERLPEHIKKPIWEKMPEEKEESTS